jgi:hypothetical protein
MFFVVIPQRSGEICCLQPLLPKAQLPAVAHPTKRVAHPLQSHRKGWVIEQSETVFPLLAQPDLVTVVQSLVGPEK